MTDLNGDAGVLKGLYEAIDDHQHLGVGSFPHPVCGVVQHIRKRLRCEEPEILNPVFTMSSEEVMINAWQSLLHEFDPLR